MTLEKAINICQAAELADKHRCVLENCRAGNYEYQQQATMNLREQQVFNPPPIIRDVVTPVNITRHPVLTPEQIYFLKNLNGL